MMEAQTAQYGPVATRVRFENDEVKVWEMDLAPAEVCGLHHHTLDYVLYILEGARVGVESPGRRPYSFVTQSRCAYYVPAGGIESAHNVDPAHRFFEALFELKRPRRQGRAQPGYAASEALAGCAPGSGTLNVLENDRVRVIESTLAPGASNLLVRGGHDAVLYVAEGGTIRLSEHPRDGESGGASAEQIVFKAGDVRWLPRGAVREIANLGDSRFRAVCVEIK
jgi:mannose-6-phosphate isomerase-like protein (cupin superfamily)